LESGSKSTDPLVTFIPPEEDSFHPAAHNHLFQAPNMIGNASLHCGSNAQGPLRGVLLLGPNEGPNPVALNALAGQLAKRLVLID
jgi:hypothetical protein